MKHFLAIIGGLLAFTWLLCYKMPNANKSFIFKFPDIGAQQKLIMNWSILEDKVTGAFADNHVHSPLQ